MKNLKQYAKYLKRKQAYEEILKDLHEPALRELKRLPDGQAVLSDVEFHITKKVERKYSTAVDAILKEKRSEIERIKKDEEDAGRVKLSEKETFDAYIPKSAKDTVLAQVNDYKKYFAL